MVRSKVGVKVAGMMGEGRRLAFLRDSRRGSWEAILVAGFFEALRRKVLKSWVGEFRVSF